MQVGIQELEFQMNMLPQTGTGKYRPRDERAETVAAGELTFLLAWTEHFPENLGLSKHNCCHPAYITQLHPGLLTIKPHVPCSSQMIAKVKVKFTLEQTTRAQRGRRGIALLFL
jgi:hypothetical protein